MMVSNYVSAYQAAIYSVRLANRNFGLMFIWINIVGLLIPLAIATPYYLGLAILIPFLAYATFDANRLLSRDVSKFYGKSYEEKFNNFTSAKQKD